jgi:hypothetical protein
MPSPVRTSLWKMARRLKCDRAIPDGKPAAPGSSRRDQGAPPGPPDMKRYDAKPRLARAAKGR